MKSFYVFTEEKAKDQYGEYDKITQDILHQDNKVKDYRAFKAYSGGHSYNVNGFLHRTFRGKTDPHNKKEQNMVAKGIIRGMDRVLDNTKTTKDMHLYSGVKESPAKLWDIHHVNPNSPVTCIMPAYTSCSTDLKITREFTRPIKRPTEFKPRNDDAPDDDSSVWYDHVLRIDIPKGSAVASIKDQSQYKRENEMLLHRDSIVRIDPKPTIDKKRKIILWHCTLLGRNPHKAY